MGRIIQKQAPRRRAPKPKTEELKRGRKILVEDLRVGDRIVTRWHKLRELDEGQTLEALQTFFEEGEVSYVAKSEKVDTIEECQGKWRTHVHVNKRMCYDLRSYVWIVA